MSFVVGVDGFKGGWVAAHDRDGAIALEAFVHMEDLWAAFHDAEVIAIDVPIGLTCGPRACDIEARRTLNQPTVLGRGRRGSSVFPAPCRCTFLATTHGAASAATLACQQKKISKQSFAILPKVKDVDVHLGVFDGLRAVAREIHPELCFVGLLGQPAAQRKSTKQGFAERFDGLKQALGELPIRMRTGWTHPSRGYARPDDVLDALVALWTARRIADGTATRVPRDPEEDLRGLPMEMWM